MTAERPALPAAIESTGMIAILRAGDVSRVPSVMEVLLGEGLQAAEVALTTPGAVAAIAALIDQFGGDACVGAGTVVTAEQARACVDAGARFLVAPSVVPEVLEIAATTGVPCIPGAFTPSEVVSCWDRGACAVKLFPASTGGPAHLCALRDPLPHVSFIPTGGVSLDDVAEYIRSGATAVGLGGALIGSALRDGDLSELRKRAHDFRVAVARARADETSGSVAK